LLGKILLIEKRMLDLKIFRNRGTFTSQQKLEKSVHCFSSLLRTWKGNYLVLC